MESLCPFRKFILLTVVGGVVAGCLGPIARGPKPKTALAPQAPVVVPTVVQRSPTVSVRSSTDSVRHADGFAPPLAQFRVRSPYGQRGRKFHTGLDLIQSPGGGDPVLASREGVVEMVVHRGGYGRMILLRHGESGYTRYAHLKKITVRPGQTVQQGETIGFVGSSGRASGPHLHFEILTRYRKTVDPMPHLFPAKQETQLASPPTTPHRPPDAPLPPPIPAPQKVK